MTHKHRAAIPDSASVDFSVELVLMASSPLARTSAPSCPVRSMPSSARRESSSAPFRGGAVEGSSARFTEALSECCSPKSASSRRCRWRKRPAITVFRSVARAALRIKSLSKRYMPGFGTAALPEIAFRVLLRMRVPRRTGNPITTNRYKASHEPPSNPEPVSTPRIDKTGT